MVGRVGEEREWSKIGGCGRATGRIARGKLLDLT